MHSAVDCFCRIATEQRLFRIQSLTMDGTMSKIGEHLDNELLPDILAKNMKEVNENPETTEEDIKEFRNLILEDKELHAKLDDEFLLRFLRARKFDKQRALALIQDYYNIRYKNKSMFENAKPSLLRHAFESNIQNILPHRDNLGRRIGILKAANWDPAQVKMEHLIVAASIACEKLLQDKETQLCGISSIMDAKDFTFYQARNISIFDIRNVAVMNMNCFPIRIKEMHVVNESLLMRKIVNILKIFLTKKLRDRLYLHGNDYSSLHKHIPAAILPEEFGGEQPSTDNRKLYQSLLDSEEYFEDLLTFGYGKKPDNKPPNM